MKRKQLITFAGLVALVAGYAVYDWQQEQRAADLKEEQSRVIQLKADQINFIQVEKQDQSVTVEKGAEGWRITAPIADEASNNATEQFLQAMMTEKSKSTAIEGENIDLADFGLDKPKGVIRIKDNLGEERAIAVGSVKNFQGDSYLRIDDRKEILIAGSTWLARVEKGVLDFREKRLMRAPAAKVEGFTIRSAQGNAEILSKDAKWISVQQPEMKLDQNKVREFITLLTLTEALEFAVEGKPKAPELQNWNLAPAKWSVQVKLSDNKTWSAAVAEGKDRVHRAHVNPPEFVLKLSPTDGNKLTAYNLDRFRDRNEPFYFEKNKVTEVLVKTPLKNFALKKENDKWSLVKAQEGFAADQDKVVDLINRLPTLELLSFTGKKDHPSLGKSPKSIELKSSSGESLIKLEVGALTNIGNKESVYYARTNLFPEVFTLSEEDFINLQLESLVSEPGKTEPTPQQEKEEAGE